MAPALMRRAPAVVPACALALLSVASGTWVASATAAGAAVSHLAVLALALAGAAAWRDPLALGRRGRWLPAALLVAVAASCWASPVGRAGWTVVALLPAWLLVPAATAHLWRRRSGPGVAAVAAVVAWVAGVALAGMVLHGDPRASGDLGHHNLLAVWLVALLPLAVLPWRRGGRQGGGWRWSAAAAGGSGLLALALTRSLSGALALVAMSAVALLLRRRFAMAGQCGWRGWSRSRRLATASLLAVPLVAALPRLLAILRGADLSVAARRTYWAAGWEGFTVRPTLGWGPGSTPWTVYEWLHWVPGVNPPQELVGDLHSLPLTLLYELGATGAGLAAAVVGLFAYRRWRELPRGRDPVLAAAGLAGLAGAVVASFGVSPLAVPAVVMALALSAGAALAGGAPVGVAPEEAAMEATMEAAGERRSHRLAWSAWPAWLGLAAAALLLAWLDLAHWHYDRSIGASETGGQARAQEELARAVSLDPAFPLYRAHLAGFGKGSAAASQALAAAEGAAAVPALWLQAGGLALAAGEPWAGIALERACRLDPLGPVAPFLLARLALAQGDRPAAARYAARALLAEPRLAASTFLGEDPELVAAVAREVRAWPGLNPGWRVAMAGVLEDGEHPFAGGPVRDLRLVTGGDRSTSLAFFTFRRRPRPLQLGSIPLHIDRAQRIGLPGANGLANTSGAAFGDRGCGAGD